MNKRKLTTGNRRLKLIRNLNDPHNDLMRIAILVEEIEFYHWVVAFQITFDVHDLITL
jgi:hypothetical protein